MSLPDWKREMEDELLAFDDEDRALLCRPFGEPTPEEDDEVAAYLYPELE